MTTTVVEKIAALCVAIENCKRRGNTEWEAKYEECLDELVEQYLPRGSGFDSGTKVDIEKTDFSKVVMTTSFHHMDDSGMYIKWTDHTITAKPSFLGGFELKISGENFNDIKEYMAETFSNELSQPYTE